MISLQAYHTLARSLMSPDGTTEEDNDNILIRVRPNMQVALRRAQLTEENKAKFIEGMRQLEGIEGGPSYVAMAGQDQFHLTQTQALVAIAIGKAFGLWGIVPYVMGDEAANAMFERDTIRLLPMVTGLKVAKAG